MLEDKIKAQLKAYLEKLVNPIELVFYTDKSIEGQRLTTFLNQVKEQSDKVSLIFGQAGDERNLSFSVRKNGEEARVSFAGIPMGHEFTSFVLALLQVSGYPPKVDVQVIEQIKGLTGPYKFETYISLTCHNCPDVVQALNLLAAINPNITSVMIDGATNQQEVKDRQIMAVPTVYLNGEVFGQGRMTLEEILAKVDTGAKNREIEKLAGKEIFDVLVVGGGPAGASAAIYAARKGIHTGVVADRFGGQVLDTLGIENFISVKETQGPKLAQALEEHVKEYNVDIMNLQRAVKLSTDNNLHQITLENGAILKAKSVILATGARWREMNVPGEGEYRNRGVAYCPHCDGPLFKGKAVAVVGGGNSGVEAAIDLAGIVSHVTLLEFAPALKADAVLQRKLYSLPNVTVITNAQTTSVIGNGKHVTAVNYLNRETKQEHSIELAGIFVQIGLLPNTDWLKGTINLSKFGEIEVDARGATSLPGVFAAGDATTVPYKQIIIAMGEGSKASLSAFDYLIRHTL